MGCGSSREIARRSAEDLSVDQNVVVWPNQICGKCAKSPIVGLLYKCENCTYVVCSKCYATYTHQHKLLPMTWQAENTDALILQRVMQTLVGIPWHFVFVVDRIIAAFTTGNIARQTVVFSVSSSRVQLLARGICVVPTDKVARVCQGLTYLNNEVSVGRFSYYPLDSTVSFQVSYIEMNTGNSPLFREYLQLTIARLDGEVPRLRRLCLGDEPIEDIFPHDVPLHILVERDTTFCRFLQTAPSEVDVQSHGDFKGPTQQMKNILLERKAITSDPTLEELRQDAGLYAPFALGEIRCVLQLLLRNHTLRNIVVQKNSSNGGVLSISCKYPATWKYFMSCGFREKNGDSSETLQLDAVDTTLLELQLRKVEDPYSKCIDSMPTDRDTVSLMNSDRRSITSCVTDPEIHEMLNNPELMQQIFTESSAAALMPSMNNTAPLSSSMLTSQQALMASSSSSATATVNALLSGSALLAANGTGLQQQQQQANTNINGSNSSGDSPHPTATTATLMSSSSGSGMFPPPNQTASSGSLPSVHAATPNTPMTTNTTTNINNNNNNNNNSVNGGSNTSVPAAMVR
eukprot:PhM_4_TR8152/c0_g1_i1/m.41291